MQYSKDIFIGIDGGGTKSKVRVEDTNGTLLSEARSGPANIRLSVDQSWQSILDGTNEALRKIGLSITDKNYHFHIGLGLAGCELPEACNNFLSKPHPFTTLVLNKDSYVACLGAHNGGDGAIIIIGTGVVGVQIEKEHVTQVGGWGFPHDDEGGGAWLGLQATGLTLKWLDGRLSQTNTSEVLKKIYAKFNNNLTQLVTWANNTNSTGFAEIAPIVLQAASNNDNIAINLMKKAASAIDLIGEALVKQNKYNHKIPLPCALFGGIAPFIEPYLGAELKKYLVKRNYDAATGAILMVKNKLIENK